MASLSDGLALTRGGSSLAFFSSIVLAELDFIEFLMMPSDFRLSLAALVIRACFKSSLAVLLAALEKDEYLGVPSLFIGSFANAQLLDRRSFRLVRITL